MNCWKPLASVIGLHSPCVAPFGVGPGASHHVVLARERLIVRPIRGDDAFHHRDRVRGAVADRRERSRVGSSHAAERAVQAGILPLIDPLPNFRDHRPLRHRIVAAGEVVIRAVDGFTPCRSQIRRAQVGRHFYIAIGGVRGDLGGERFERVGALREVDAPIDIVLLDERQQLRHAAPTLPIPGGAIAGGREHAILRLVVHDRQADLLHVIHALGTVRRFPCRLHGGQQQRDENADDRDHDQQLNQREAAIRVARPSHRSGCRVEHRTASQRRLHGRNPCVGLKCVELKRAGC